MLRQLPRRWLFKPDQGGQETQPALTGFGGQGGTSKCVSTWLQRKHMWGQLRGAWPPADTVDVQWLRSWCPDSKSRMGDFEDSLKLSVLEIKAGCPYHELTMWLCLVGPFDADAHECQGLFFVWSAQC